MTIKKIIAKPTLIFILSLIGIPYGIYGLTLDGSKTAVQTVQLKFGK